LDQDSVIVPITTAASHAVQGYQYWEIENPPGNANAIFVNLVTTATTTGTQSTEVLPGSKYYAFVNQIDNPNGVSLIAATGATTVIRRRETFRTRLGYTLAVVGGSIAAVVGGSLWRLVSGSTTAIQPKGAVTQARADTYRNKTAGTGLGIYTDAAATGIALRPGTAPTVTASETRFFSDDGSDYIRLLNGNIVYVTNNIARGGVTDSGLNGNNASPLLMYNGNGADLRHTLSPTHRVLHTPVAGGDIDSVLDTIERPIDDGVVLAAGNSLVMVSSTTGRLALATTANVTQGVLGICVVGGTGNAGGTVFGRVGILGWFYGILADAAGVVGGQFVKPGTTTANQVESQTTPSLITFGRALITRANGVATELYLRGMG